MRCWPLPRTHNLLWQWQAVWTALHTTMLSFHRKLRWKESSWQLSILKSSVCIHFHSPLTKLLECLPQLTQIRHSSPLLQMVKALLVKVPHTISHVHSCDLHSYLECSSFVQLTQTFTHSLRFRIDLHFLQWISLAASRLLFALSWLAQ